MEEDKATTFSYCFDKDAAELLKFYRHSSEAADVTLCCIDNPNSSKVVYTRAHKMIISTASPIIKDILEKKNDDGKYNSFIYLAGVSKCCLSLVLNYLYNGKVLVPKECLEPFTKIVKRLQIKLVEAEADVKSEFIANLASAVTNGNFSGSPDQVLNQLSPSLMEPKIEANTNSALLPLPPGITSQSNYPNGNLNAASGAFQEKQKMKTSKDGEKKAKVPKLSVKEKAPDAVKAKNTEKSPSNKESGPVDPAISAAALAVSKEWKAIHTKTDDKGFHCLKCPEVKTFTNSGNLNRHYKQSHEQTCKFCKFPFLNEELLQSHIEEKHQFKCPTCVKIFTNKGNLNRHQKQGCGVASSADALFTPGTETHNDPNNNETKTKSKKVKKEITDADTEAQGKSKKIKKEKLDMNNNEGSTLGSTVKVESSLLVDTLIKPEPAASA